ncbi:hypothetical protein F4561_001217 [Lipingzhangella halophila]|uniref:Uncharacterized protein n=1 Tax=Lipingzhangella halophila TaxID=1783352 RepID=A0A7W7RE96_9ACTN|nr:hypothetical protein [Lipingzhangella halophila]MBB4930397.1 hypothetical protein [Lipingzhangella halophila]
MGGHGEFELVIDDIQDYPSVAFPRHQCSEPLNHPCGAAEENVSVHDGLLGSVIGQGIGVTSDRSSAGAAYPDICAFYELSFQKRTYVNRIT